jgi:hypothetical protein
MCSLSILHFKVICKTYVVCSFLISSYITYSPKNKLTTSEATKETFSILKEKYMKYYCSTLKL